MFERLRYVWQWVAVKRRARREEKLRALMSKILAASRCKKCMAETERENEIEHGKVCLSGDGFAFHHVVRRRFRRRAITREVRWRSVRHIGAYKRDCFVYDLVCVLFTMDDGQVFELQEDMAGFSNVTERMSQVFDGIPDGWYGRVSAGAYQTNAEVLWVSDQRSAIIE